MHIYIFVYMQANFLCGPICYLVRNLILDLGPTLLLISGKQRLYAIFQIFRGNTTLLIPIKFELPLSIQ